MAHAGRTVSVPYARGRNGVWVGFPGGSRFFPREEAAESAASGPHHEEVRAPMTGKVVEVKVGPGDTVQAGAVVAILEAMKMEYKLTAPRAGRVGTVSCRAGDKVDLGQVLVSLED